MNQIKNKIFTKPFLFYLITCLIGIIIILLLDFKDEDFSYHDILVEAHGLIYDLVIFGILFAIYDSIKSKKEQITKLEDEIEDFRKWESEEATHKIVGNIRRLYDLGITKFNLNGCYLINTDLSDYNFADSYFSFAKMKNSSLTRSNLQDAKMIATDLENTYLTKANFENTNLKYANLKGVKMILTNFRGANLSSVNLSNAEIVSSEFEGANMTNIELRNLIVDDVNWIKNLKKQRVKGAKKINRRFYIDEKSRFINNEIVFYKVQKRKKIPVLNKI